MIGLTFTETKLHVLTVGSLEIEIFSQPRDAVLHTFSGIVLLLTSDISLQQQTQSSRHEIQMGAQVSFFSHFFKTEKW